MSGIGRGDQAQTEMRGWAPVYHRPIGASVPRAPVDRTEIILTVLLAASILIGLAVLLLGWESPLQGRQARLLAEDQRLMGTVQHVMRGETWSAKRR
jgi:hypothetical protein